MKYEEEEIQNSQMSACSSSGSDERMEKARQHIDEIRKNKFSIGSIHPNPLIDDLQNAVTNLSSELYTKDFHFLMEIIQNAEDNDYLEGVKPTLEFVITGVDVTGVGAPATLLVFNNEVGFSRSNIDSLCSIGRSTKKGRRDKGYIGEKGIGFKSVFLVTSWPHVFSNGYQIRFSEVPNQDCGIGYIVPEWIAKKPSVSDLQAIYGSSSVLPATTIILPLKPEKVEAIKKELAEIKPEVLLFLHKIRQLSVRESFGGSQPLDSVSAVSITSETKPICLRSREADSRVVDLSYQKKSDKAVHKCRYYIWKQNFPVKAENLVSSRKNVKEWVISLAFPVGERLNSGDSAVGIFAFLPTTMVTNFPFIIQADFLLASSRETISFDSKWNLGILKQVPASFLGALTTCVKSTATAEVFSLYQVLSFLPVKESPYQVLNEVRQTIKSMLMQKCVVPYEPFSDNKIPFCKPIDAVRVSSAFRAILRGTLDSERPLQGISSERKFVLHESVDTQTYDQVWNFLEIPSAADCKDWYWKCIGACNLISRASVEVYVELLFFLADNWKSLPLNMAFDIPFLKYVTYNGDTRSCSLSQIKRERLKIVIVWDLEKHTWLNSCSLEMGCPANIFFFPDAVVGLIMKNKRRHILQEWIMSKGDVLVTDVFGYCEKLSSFLKTSKDPELVILSSHLIYHSSMKNYMTPYQISTILLSFPLVDVYGNVVQGRQVLVPAEGSKWVELFGSDNPYGDIDDLNKYVVLGEVYDETRKIAGECIPEKNLSKFFKEYHKSVDLPCISPKDGALLVTSSKLTSHEALLLLEWIRWLRAKKHKFPGKFIESIKTGKWMKTYSGFDCPPRCFLFNGTEASALLEIARTLNLLSAIDEPYYGDQIRSFKDELIFIGVQLQSKDLYKLIADHLKHLSASTMNKRDVILLLRFLKHSNQNNQLNGNLLEYLKMKKWLKTSKGYVIPSGSVFLVNTHFAEALLGVADLQVIDNIHYGSQIRSFMEELKLLGVLIVTDLEDVYKVLCEHVRLPEDLTTMTTSSVFLLLGCIKNLEPTCAALTLKIMSQPWIKTSCGFRCPPGTILFDDKWGQLSNIVSLPVIDAAHYGSRIKLFKGELQTLGVIVDLEGACEAMFGKFKLLAVSGKLSRTNVISFLNFLKSGIQSVPSMLSKMRSCLLEEKWLKTSQGYKSSSESILSTQEWATVSKFVELPLIDEAFYGTSMKSFKDELEMVGVVVSLSKGAHFVARNLELPKETKCASITPEFALSLLHCITYLRTSSEQKELLEQFVLKLRGSNWLKTHLGYKSPEQSLLYDPDWECDLKEYDAPFIDQSFYGSLASLEKDALKVLGVKADVDEVCSVIFETLNFHKKTSSIMRIYTFLNKRKWGPKHGNQLGSRLWIPYHGSDQGKWVLPRNCVLHDEGNLFLSHLLALDKRYDKEMLPFFSMVYGVAAGPSCNDYIKLWTNWEHCKHQPSSVELNLFWGCISENWDTQMVGLLNLKLTMLPATTNDGTIKLVKKEQLFISDDLQLRMSLSEASQSPLFVWLPRNGFSSVTPAKLYKIYREMGVRDICEVVHVNTKALFRNYKWESIETKDGLIGRILIKIVLCFLASALGGHISVTERHEIVKSLFDIKVYGTMDPVVVDYDLELPWINKKSLVKIRRMVLWAKHMGILFVHKPSWEDHTKSTEFVSHFASAISEAVLPDIDAKDFLCAIIKMAFECGYHEKDVNFMLMAENLELRDADKDFLDRLFPPLLGSPPIFKRSSSTILGPGSKRRSISKATR